MDYYKNKVIPEHPSRPIFHPPESLSRGLDNMVYAQEAPYGYTDAPPPYWHENAETLENIKLQKKGMKK